MRNRFINSLAKAGLLKLAVIGAVYFGAKVIDKIREERNEPMDEDSTNIGEKSVKVHVNKPAEKKETPVAEEKKEDKKEVKDTPKASIGDFAKHNEKKAETKPAVKPVTKPAEKKAPVAEVKKGTESKTAKPVTKTAKKPAATKAKTKPTEVKDTKK